VLDVKVDEVRFAAPDGGLVTLERKSDGELLRDVFEASRSWFSEHSPFGREGWEVVAARLRFVLRPAKVGQRSRIRTVELKMGGKTNLKEHAAQDQIILDTPVRRWGLLTDGHHKPDPD
jgi:hypothetical protein